MAEQKYTISDIIETYISGDWGNDEPTEDASCPVSCIRGADIVPIYNSEYRNIPLRYISEKSLSNRVLREGDIVIEKSGGSPTQSTGRVVYISKELLEEKQDIVCSNFCAAFRIKPEWDAKYVYYYLQHIYNAGVFFNFEGKTSGLKNLIMDTAFKSITIKKIAIETQRSIATVLSTIESKMAANRAINHYLEAMAKQLYDYWFVQFDFPDENGKPYKSSGGKMVWNDKLKREIPKGWYGDNICRVAEILSGGTPSKAINSYWEDGLIPFFGPTDCDGNLFQLKTSDHITYDGLNHCASSLFTEGTIILTARGSIGKYVIVGTPMAMNQSCYALHSIKEEHEYLYFLTGQLISHLKMKGSGSVFKSIIASDIEHSYLSIGDEKVISTFCKVVKPLFEEIKLKSCEMNNLQEQRDNLLPLLMNGQVSIKQLNNDLASHIWQ